MDGAAAELVGEHDFAAFGQPTVGEVTIRHMMRAGCRAEPPVVRVELEANGFLYRMVRSIVGTLLAVGRGAMSWSNYDVLESRDGHVCGSPPHGLCLTRIIDSCGFDRVPWKEHREGWELVIRN
jgi:tRNA pseudouridine38-40 synthase